MATIRISGAHDCGAMINQAQAATVDSDVLDMYEMGGLSVQVDHGVITGQLTIKCSNDGITFYAVPDVAFAAFAGSAGGELLEMGNLRSRYYKLSYTHTNGTGLLKVSVHAKGWDR